MKKSFKLSLVMLCIASLLAMLGCSSSQADHQTESVPAAQSAASPKVIVFGTESEVEKINPVLNGDQDVDTLLFRGLTKPTSDNEVAPDIAKEWTVSADQREYTFLLRDDVVWEDGEPLTAEDVKFTLDTLLDPATNSPILSDFNEIDRVEALDPHKVKITLKDPFPPLLNKLKLGLLPKHLLEGQDINTAAFNRKPVGNGPFKLKEWKPDRTIVLTRNDKFHGTKPQIDEMLIRPVTDPNTRLMQLKTGEIDLAYMELNQEGSVKDSDPFTALQMATVDYRGMLYNFRNPLFQEPEVRLAMSAAIDREALVQGILFGKGQPAYGPLQKSWANDPAPEEAEHHPEAAKALLEKAGWRPGEDGVLMKDGVRFEFDLVAPATDTVRVALANAIRTQLKPLGISVNPKPLDWSAIQFDKADAFMIAWGSEFDPDDHTYRVFHSSQIENGLYNYGAYRNDKVDKWLTEARIEPDRDKRKERYAEFQRELRKDPAFNFLVYVDALYGVSKKINGVGHRPLGHHGAGVLWNIEEWTVN
ncbi:ABC transporter substrate-binding protein [Paenibacillus apiarius]|uniref:ABC transporter substrate-binding protein n=1 Tax=Paenibacillus apiarius TaxID=46240 RepID=A0ABT4DMF7_9BACL|nr:ABC transporter substrate-binding protein [Paenibacillus apiarius]MCY9514554.1 ABC transporter substrate-binding protein [Paenibacillus apiarius]MCY9518544.1 ABC transporter substrate-binding protein [Paenibacillus apiarius]MCY9552632.1 ABC transporter substrate-binding protein [Paenibacillus apiarius]MCY9557040.1 ABC transporter substrate-binding protein [Paenibacillus apiarius]MCY9686007.1 ABC transporter substrate-binding protein [Paenibacillus apiarius]